MAFRSQAHMMVQIRVALPSVSGSIADNGHQIEIGDNNNGQFFSGSLDDVRIYNRALSAGEVKQLSNMGR
jgi:hypothetical protein